MSIDLFAELDIELNDGDINFFKKIISDTHDWQWPDTTLPNTYVNCNILMKHDFGKIINDFIKNFQAGASLLKVLPFKHVFWHIDVNELRRCVLNTQISGDNSYTFVSNCSAPSEGLVSDDSEYSTYRIPYRKNKSYLLNSQKHHSVFNTGEETIYIISFCSNLISYKESLEYFKEKGLVRPLL